MERGKEREEEGRREAIPCPSTTISLGSVKTTLPCEGGQEGGRTEVEGGGRKEGREGGREGGRNVKFDTNMA